MCGGGVCVFMCAHISACICLLVWKHSDSSPLFWGCWCCKNSSGLERRYWCPVVVWAHCQCLTCLYYAVVSVVTLAKTAQIVVRAAVLRVGGSLLLVNWLVFSAQVNFSRTFRFDLLPSTLRLLHFWGNVMAFYRFIVRENDRPVDQV